MIHRNRTRRWPFVGFLFLAAGCVALAGCAAPGEASGPAPATPAPSPPPAPEPPPPQDDYEPASFEVEGDVAFMSGIIDGTTPELVEELIEDYPDLTTIVMEEVEGSADDEANLEAAARMVREEGLDTFVPEDGFIASGGVDFFIAGVGREVEPGGELGVHSWAGEDIRGDEAPRDHPEHRKYLDYYEEMGIPAEFYWFTLEAAPPEDIHIMTMEEIRRYGLVTE